MKIEKNSWAYPCVFNIDYRLMGYQINYYNKIITTKIFE